MISNRYIIKRNAMISRLLIVAIACGCAQVAAAQFENDNPANAQKLKIAEGFCSPDGKIAECVGYPARECTTLIKPLVDTCAAKPASNRYSPEDAFQRCFWGEYMKKYGKQIDRSEKCIKGDPDKGPLQPLPSHLEKLYKPVNPEGSRQASTENGSVSLFPEDNKR